MPQNPTVLLRRRPITGLLPSRRDAAPFDHLGTVRYPIPSGVIPLAARISTCHAGYCGHSQDKNEGERVVAGQHLMQAQSDIFLGWTRATGADGVERDFYVRQLRDWKFSLPIEQMIPAGLTVYARVCGWTLAWAHARSGDRVALAAYLGGSAKFDQAIAEFAETYADQNDRDYAALQTAVKDGKAQTTTDI
jgi:hypothetical protein